MQEVLHTVNIHFNSLEPVLFFSLEIKPLVCTR